MITDKSLTISGFELSDVAPDNSVNRMLTAALRARAEIDTPCISHERLYWDADYFDLHQVSIFQEANRLEQQQILSKLNQGLLQESIYIEQAGVGYMAKMILMAESMQERMLYSLFTADETTHLAQLHPYGTLITTAPVDDPFLQLLAEIVESSDKSVLLFVLQVVLEGWGLTHYRRLARGCNDDSLKRLFQSFLQAESRHHSTGAMLFKQMQILPGSKAAIADCLATFLQMVRVGPQRVVAAISTTKGHLSRPQRIQILQQLDTVTHSHQRLQLLKSLMVGTSSKIVNDLENKGLFMPLSPEEAASYG
ncbi:MAG: ferritin-like domain-containing protein [Cyanobacteria bacterium P01_F01_bin.13]